MFTKRALVGGVAAWACCVAVSFLPSSATADWSCAQCHGTTAPRAAPSAARLDQISTYSEWEATETRTVGTRYLASYTYAVRCQTTATQYVAAYPHDPDRKDYLYMYNPKTGKHWARCSADRPAGTRAEWSFYLEGKGWSEETKTDIKVPGSNRKVIDPPLPPL